MLQHNTSGRLMPAIDGSDFPLWELQHQHEVTFFS